MLSQTGFHSLQCLETPWGAYRDDDSEYLGLILEQIAGVGVVVTAVVGVILRVMLMLGVSVAGAMGSDHLGLFGNITSLGESVPVANGGNAAS